MSIVKHYYTFPKKIMLNFVGAGGLMLTVIIQSSLMKFYTDVIGLEAALYGIIFMIYSIWNGINDPIIGFWADSRPYTKWGKYKKVIRWALPILLITALALFYVSPEWPTVVICIALLLLLVAYEAAKTMLDVSFNAFKINTFFSIDERTQVQMIGSYVAQIPVFIGGIIPIVFLTGDYTDSVIITVFSVSVVLALILTFIGSIFVKEDPHFYDNLEPASNLSELKSLFKTLIKDRTFLIYCLGFFVMYSATGNYMNGYLYYMDNIVNATELQATIPDILTGVAQMLTLPLIFFLVKKHGSRNTLVFWSLFSVLGFLILSLKVNYYLVAFAYIIILVGYGASGSLQQPMQGLVIDHMEQKTGIRNPGGIAGIIMLFLIPVQSIPPLILSIAMSLSHYDGSVQQQTETVENALRISIGLIPAIILSIGLIIMYKLPIDKKREEELLTFMKDKHGHTSEVKELEV